MLPGLSNPGRSQFLGKSTSAATKNTILTHQQQESLMGKPSRWTFWWHRLIEADDDESLEMPAPHRKFILKR
jgi:hypothetical protein